MLSDHIFLLPHQQGRYKPCSFFPFPSLSATKGLFLLPLCTGVRNSFPYIILFSLFGRGTTPSSWSFSSLRLLSPSSKTIQTISRTNKAPCENTAVLIRHTDRAPSVALNRQAGRGKINSCDKAEKNVPTWVFNSLTAKTWSLIYMA